VRAVGGSALCAALGLLALAMWPVAAAAQTVAFSGRMGDRALLVINGAPRTLAVGASEQGVKLLSANANEAVIERGGQRATLLLGGSPVSLGGKAGDAAGTQIVLTAGPGGHFVASGSINGRAARFMVDTGASVVAMGQADAERLGLNYKAGVRGMVNTANGPVPVQRAVLDVVRVGDVQVYNVEAVVLPSAMDTILLGNSFLNRFQMKRDNERMTLDRK